jgi:hypothetical protein
MREKFELIMRDPRKAPNDTPVLARTERGYVTAMRDRDGTWFCVDDVGDPLSHASYGDCWRATITPLFYCELPK